MPGFQQGRRRLIMMHIQITGEMMMDVLMMLMMLRRSTTLVSTIRSVGAAPMIVKIAGRRNVTRTGR